MPLLFSNRLSARRRKAAQILAPPSIDGAMDQKDIGETQIRFEQGIDQQRAKAAGTDAGDEKDELPGELHQYPDGQNPGQRVPFFFRAADVVEAQDGIPDKQEQGHDAVVASSPPGDDDPGKSPAEVLAEQGNGQPCLLYTSPSPRD